MEIISVDHTNFLVKVSKIPCLLLRLPTNTLNIRFKTKVVQNKIITHTSFLEKNNYCGPQ